MKVLFDTRNSRYMLTTAEGDDAVSLVKVGALIDGRVSMLSHKTLVSDVKYVRIAGLRTAESVKGFVEGLESGWYTGRRVSFYDRGGAGWAVTELTGPAADPTAIPIEFDPFEKRMRGIAVHGNTPFDVPFISTITAHLHMGGCADGLVLPDHITRVLSLYPWEHYEIDETKVERKEITLYDAGLPDPDLIYGLADFVIDWLVDGQDVLVHCQAGLNRSALIVGTVLVQHFKMSGIEAIRTMQAKRSPAVLCNPEFEVWVRDLALT